MCDSVRLLFFFFFKKEKKKDTKPANCAVRK